MVGTEIGRLKRRVGDLTMTTELLEAKIERLEVATPSAAEVEAMSRQVCPPPTGLTRSCG
jgi:hypothetical protein